DTGRYPYGPRPLEEVRTFARQITTKLVEEHHVKLVVVACNTAAAAGLDGLSVDVPVTSVVEPGLRATLRATTTGRIGVIGTVGTIASGAYQRAVAGMEAPMPIELTCAACPGFVEFVERGETDSDQVYVLAERLLAPVRAAEVDALLLGCTHYPFLARTISDVVGRDVVLVSSADETAFEVRAMLEATGKGRVAEKPGSAQWISSGDVATFRRLGRRLLGPEIDRVEAWEPPGSS
ncbi:MAG: glutamate racemase, partial [Acidimicrobiaceae bacterium]|nr:glutamate racemase [Acidimicrobiaceae bacterium]